MLNLEDYRDLCQLAQLRLAEDQMERLDRLDEAGVLYTASDVDHSCSDNEGPSP
jgi:hypothetical protein